MVRNRGGWSDAKLEILSQVTEVINGLEEYWPLTLRQIYYQLVSVEIIPNVHSEYRKLSELLAKARLDRRVPWASMEDRSRSQHQSGGFYTPDQFIDREIDNFLEGYRRHLLQGQGYRWEVWVEKDALSRIVHNAVYPYCVPVVVGKGFSSISFVNDCRIRVDRGRRAGVPTRILYMGDMDPSGWEMLPSMMETLRDEMDLRDWVQSRRVALTLDQITEYDLPHDPSALKWGDSRARKYVEQFGEIAVELDALHPETLAEVIQDALEDELDMDRFRRQQEIEQDDLVVLEELKNRVEPLIQNER